MNRAEIAIALLRYTRSQFLNLIRLLTSFASRNFENELGRRLSQYLDAATIRFDQSSSNQWLGERSPDQDASALEQKLSTSVADLYGAPYARINLGGSSNTIRQIVGHVLPRSAPGKTILLVDPVCHKSVFGGLVESGLDVVFLKRIFSKRHGLHTQIDQDDLIKALDKYGELIAAVVITHPTYEGFNSDLPLVSRVCNMRGVLLCIDSAWGSNYGLVEGMPECAIKYADIVVCSPHKKGLAPSQISTALFKNPALCELYDEASRIGCATTSPNWNLLLLFEHRLQSVRSGAWNIMWQAALEEARSFRTRVSEIHPNLKCLEPSDLETSESDITHVYIDTSRAPLRAKDWATTLAQSFKIDVEMSSPNGLLLLFGPGHAGMGGHLIEELREAFHQTQTMTSKVWYPPGDDLQAVDAPINPRKAYLAPQSSKTLNEAIGQTSASLVYVYPPGIPLLSYGQTITQEHINAANRLICDGYTLSGLGPNGTICVNQHPSNESHSKTSASKSSEALTMQLETTELVYKGYPFGEVPLDVLTEVGELFREVFSNPPYNQFAASVDTPTKAKSFAEFAPEGYAAKDKYLSLDVLDRAKLPPTAFRWMAPGEFDARFEQKRSSLYVSTARAPTGELAAFSIGRILTVRELFYTEEIRNPVYYSGREFIRFLRAADEFYTLMQQHFNLSPNDQLFFALGYGAHPSYRGKNSVAELMNSLAENVLPEHAHLPALAEIPEEGAGRIFSQAVHEKTIHGIMGTSHSVVYASTLKSVMEQYAQGSRHLMSLVRHHTKIKKSGFHPHPSDHKGIEVRQTPDKGEGVFATQDINPGEMIAEFIGDIYSAELESQLPPILVDRCIQVGAREYVFAEHRLAEKINHSCDPNCGVREKTKIVAIKPIKAGDEISWDYRMSENSDWVLVSCKCGAERCSRKIEGYDSLPNDIRDEYLSKGAVSTWLLDRY